MPQLLFITSSRIGDAVLASGVLAWLLDQYPGAEVEIACGSLPAPLFRDVPGLRRIHAMTKAGRVGHWLRLWRATAGRRWDAVVDLRSAVFAWTVPARRRLVARIERDTSSREHRVEELARLLGLPQPPAPRLWVSPARAARAAASLGEGPPVLAVGPGGNWPRKIWPADRFAALVTRLTAPSGVLPGARVAVLAGSEEAASAAPVLAAVPPGRRIERVGAPDLLDLAAELARCAFYVGNDSGLMHLAAAAGVPTLGLFGPSPEWRYRPWGPRAAYVRTPESLDDMVKPGFDIHAAETLMGGLTVDAVAAAAAALWARAGTIPAPLSAGSGGSR